MSVRAERVAPPASSPPKPQEIVTNFDPEALKAPFSLRCGALLIDYILFISVPVLTLIIGRMLGDDGRKLLSSELSNAGWLVAFLLALTNFMIFPMLTGQTIGKMLTGIQIVRIDGRSATFGTLLLRHLVGYPLTALTVGLGFLISALNPKGRALHDFLTGTMVVYGKRRRR